MAQAWHAMSIEEVFQKTKTAHQGLSGEEVASRLRTYGSNEIPTKTGPSYAEIFARQFFNPLIYILVLASLVKFAVGHRLDGTVLMCTILVMVLIGFFQEAKAVQAMEALKKLSSPKSKVKREGRLLVVSSSLLVPGDMIVLESGDLIPADSRLIETSYLKVNESSLTGESFPVEKHTGGLEEQLGLADRKNMVYRGTAVSQGKATALVVETGGSTEIGKIAQAIQELKPGKTPLQKSIHSLGNWMLLIVFLAVLIFIAISFYRELNWLDIFMLSVSAAVAAIPEGLPAAVTVVLASGMTMMAKRKAIIRKMMAVETLGSTTVICSDKTGTLTVNQMTVKKIYSCPKFVKVSGEGKSTVGEFHQDDQAIQPQEDPQIGKIFEIGALCNDALLTMENDKTCEVIGDPTEGALLVAAAKSGSNLEEMKMRMPRSDEIPFQSENLYMATLHTLGNERFVFVKGSPEKLLSFSTSVLRENEMIPLDEPVKKEISASLESMAKEAFRLIAVAYCDFEGSGSLSERDFKGRLVFAGAFALMDPPREEALDSVRMCKEAGVRVVMVTGDNKLTAVAIAEKLGVDVDGAVEGRELGAISDGELESLVKTTNVFARIEPLHKLRIVQSLQKLGEIVAMTGDGVNDAPALERADIGIAMGITGTEVAKEASDMVLADDNFSSIVAAIEEGRAIFNRLRNVCAFLLTTCLGELFGLTICVFFTGLAPLLPLQILWINLATGVIMAVPLGLEPKTGRELQQPPRDPKTGLIYPGMVFRILFLSHMLGFSMFFLFWWGLAHTDLVVARTLVFSSVVAFEALMAFQLRSEEISPFVLGLLKNKPLIFCVGIAFLLQLFVLYLPLMNRLFQVQSISWQFWGLVLLPGIAIFLVEEVRKRFFARLFSRGK